jgi:hypothetical protein
VRASKPKAKAKKKTAPKAPAAKPASASPGEPPPAEQPAARLSAPPTATVRRRFGFAFEPRMTPFAFALGATPLTSWVEVADGELRVRFGPWTARTSVANVTGAQVTGPYNFVKVVGPPRLSRKDSGATFATSTRRGVCITFREPIPAAVPFGLLKHEGLTVTVDDPDGLVAALTGAA